MKQNSTRTSKRSDMTSKFTFRCSGCGARLNSDWHHCAVNENVAPAIAALHQGITWTYGAINSPSRGGAPAAGTASSKGAAAPARAAGSKRGGGGGGAGGAAQETPLIPHVKYE